MEELDSGDSISNDSQKVEDTAIDSECDSPSSSQVVRICAFSPYRARRKTRKQTFLVFRGAVIPTTDNFQDGEAESIADRFHCKILVNSGCEEICMSKAYADKLKLLRDRTDLKAELWDGSLVPMDRCSDNLTVRIGEAKLVVRPYVVDMIAYDLILGKVWLSEVNPRINWEINRMLLSIDGKPVTLDAEAPEKEELPEYILSSTQFKRLAVKSKRKIYHVIIKPDTDKNDQVVKDQELTELLNKYEAVFPKDLPDGLPPERSVEMSIRLEADACPKKGPIYKLSRAELSEMKKQIDELLAKGLIRPSVSPWGSPVLFTPKKDGALRMCIDYRALNKKRYHQIRVSPLDVEKTAFRTRHGSFEFLVTPFGLTGAPGCFQTLMNNVLRPYLDQFVLVYLDDILIYSKTKKEHLKHLGTILKTLKEHELYGKLSKCEFMKKKVSYLGHIITEKGISMDPIKIDSIVKWEPPQNITQVQSFLGLCNYYRRFVKDFAMISVPLSNLTKKDVKFEWKAEQQEAFDTLKKCLTTAPVLRCADPNLPC